MATSKILFVMSQPTQSVEPFHILNSHMGLDVTLTFLSSTDSKLWHGEEFLNKEVLRLKVPDSIRTIWLRNISPRPSLNSRFGLIHPSIISSVVHHDCVVIYGHAYLSMWFALLAAKLRGKKVVLSNDSIGFQSSSRIRRWLKAIFYRFLYNRLSHAVLVPSTSAADFLQSLGVRRERIFLTPYVVDNHRIKELAKQFDKTSAKEHFGIGDYKKVVLFVGKLLPRKRPLDLLLAFSQTNIPEAGLVYVGDGPLLNELKSEIKRLGLEKRVTCLGNLDYERLIEMYVAADVLVHPADHEPWGLIVNEAMLCRLPVVTSDRVGAARDLIREGQTGFTYPVGDTIRLAQILNELLSDEERLSKIGNSAQVYIESWSPNENAAGHLKAFESLLGPL